MCDFTTKGETMKKITYIRCPRCELNYITKDEKFCSVCKQEMQVGGGENLEDYDLELCPICKNNYIQPDEIMCASCYAERANDPNYDGDEDKEWSEYINRDEQDDDYSDSQEDEIGDMASVKDLGLNDDLDDDYDDDDLVIGDEDEPDELDDDDDYENDDDDDDDYDDYDDDDDDDA